MSDLKQPEVSVSTERRQEEQVEHLRETVSTNIAFIIERSKNKNVVVYEGKVGEDGALNAAEPLGVYWLDIDPEYVAKARASGKTDDRVELNFLERTAAYGCSAKPAEAAGEYRIHMVALPSRDLTLYLKDGKPRARIVINGKDCDLFKIHIESQDRWVGPPKVLYAEIHGDDCETGEPRVERLHP